MNKIEVIDKDQLLIKLTTWHDVLIGNDKELMNKVIKYVTDFPIFDTKPVVILKPQRNGEWKINSDGYYPYCSCCGKEPLGGMSDFCPNCGAEMRQKD